VEVRIGSHAWVVELAPCSADLVARLKNGERRVGKKCRDAVCGVYTRDAASDDENVEGIGRRHVPVGMTIDMSVHRERG
jgi:hypothetical protein